MKRLVHASLFSGIGGPEVAAAFLGWENAFHCEINPFGRAVLEYWFPESVSYEDIKKTDFRHWRGRIDVLTGGFPCQPFSYAGKRGGREDERYLWPEMLRVIGEVRPTWVVGENVAGITTMVEGGVLTDLGCEETLFGEGPGIHRYELKQSFTIERICRDLEAVGYSVQPVLIPAAACGAPHRRDRVFFLARTVADAAGDGHSAQEAGGCLAECRDYRHDEPAARGLASERTDGLHTVQGVAQDSRRDGCDQRQLAQQGGQRDEWYTCARDCQRICEEERVYTSDPDGGRGREVHQHVQGGEHDGPEPIRDGGERHASDTDGARLQESILSGRDADSTEEVRGLHDRAERPGRDADPAYAFRARLAAAIQSGLYGQKERDDAGRSALLASDDAWTQGTWWDNFPTVSPVHAGNDGIPIRLDGITLPAAMQPRSYRNSDPQRFNFGRWRTESIRAYGNAIVPQVMYRIFQAIEQVC